MRLQAIRFSNFQSFGAKPMELDLDSVTYLIGPNGAGKTAALQALCRMFAFDPSLRRIKRSDFHVPQDEDEKPEERSLWIEADFVLPELTEDSEHPTIPVNFRHMRLHEPNDVSRIRYRLKATMGIDGDIDEHLFYVFEVNLDGSPLNPKEVSRKERNDIQVHYLPARRDPTDHITFGANALLGRILRAANWRVEREEVKGFTDQISNSLTNNVSVNALSNKLKKTWTTLHKGNFFSNPKITFLNNGLEALLRHLTVSFSPGHDDVFVDFSHLSDGQKSMLYLSLVLSSQEIGSDVLAGDNSFDPNKLRPPVFTLVALEEPENSLSPLYLGRIVSALDTMASKGDAQGLIATHAPSLLRRVEPEQIRYLRLSENRQTYVTKIKLPEVNNDAYKFVREAVQAFPEIYFSRLVVLGEGDSEEIILTRLLKAKGAPVDESAVTVAPLGGRHVNHFWRLLHALNIPFITLLDLDLGRYQGGWGRISYIVDQLSKYPTTTYNLEDKHISSLPRWDDRAQKLLEGEYGLGWLKWLECQQVFFSDPLDLDFAMLKNFSEAYELDINEQTIPDDQKIKSVLGKNYQGAHQYSEDDLKLFVGYYTRFKLRSKPAAHINALSKLSDTEFLAGVSPSLDRLANAVIAKLAELPE